MATLQKSQRARPATPAKTPAPIAKVGASVRAPNAPPEIATKPRKAEAARIKVEAVQVGYYDHKRLRIGDVFTIDGTRFPEGHKQAGEIQAFSKRWMKLADPSAPESTTTPNQAIRREHDAILSGATPNVVPDNVPDNLPVGTANPLGAD